MIINSDYIINASEPVARAIYTPAYREIENSTGYNRYNCPNYESNELYIDPQLDPIAGSLEDSMLEIFKWRTNER